MPLKSIADRVKSQPKINTSMSSRGRLWPVVRAANRLIQVHTTTDPRLHFIDLTDAILGIDDKPNPSLFRMGRLHPNKKWDAQWTSTIKPILQVDFSKDPWEISL